MILRNKGAIWNFMRKDGTTQLSNMVERGIIPQGKKQADFYYTLQPDKMANARRDFSF